MHLPHLSVYKLHVFESSDYENTDSAYKGAVYNSVKQRGIVTTINVDSNKRVWSDNGHYDSRNRTYLHASRLVPPEQVLVVKNQ